MKLAKMVWRVSRATSNPVSAFFSVLSAYRQWYRYGRVCVHAIENTMTSTSAAFVVVRDYGVKYDIEMEWYNDRLQVVPMRMSGETSDFFETYVSVIVPMIESVDIYVEHARKQGNNSTVTYITDTGMYVVTFTTTKDVVLVTDIYRL